MSVYLLKDIRKFRADSQLEAERLINSLKRKYDVTSHRMIRKDKKDETYFIVEVVISVNSEKEPFTSYTIED